MSDYCMGPEFQVESDRAIVILGNSERKEVGEFFARTLDERRIFSEIDVITLNRGAAMIGRASLRQAMEVSTVITHSAGIMRVPNALQVVAINPPEPVALFPLMKRALFEVPNDPIDVEEGAHETGLVDMIGAGVELARSPITSAKTTLRIAGGYSTSARLMDSEEDFPAGRAMVHSEHDSFGFAALADMNRAALAGVTTVMLPEHYHNEVLFAPSRTLDMLTPAVFPAVD